MKTVSVFLLLTVAVLANAQSQCLTVVSQIPSCGVSCLSSAASSVGCAQTDLACQCSSSQSSAIKIAALDCIVNHCGAVTGRQISSSALAVCSCVATAGDGTNSASTTSTTSSTSRTWGFGWDFFAASLPTYRTTTSIATATGVNAPTTSEALTPADTTTTTDTAPPPPPAIPPIVGPPNPNCPPVCPPPDIPDDPTGPNDPTRPTKPTNPTPIPTTRATTTSSTPETSSPSTSSSSSSESYQIVEIIEDIFVTDDPAVIDSQAVGIISEESLEACMAITTSFQLVGTPCAPTSTPPPVTNTTAPISTPPPVTTITVTLSHSPTSTTTVVVVTTITPPP